MSVRRRLGAEARRAQIIDHAVKLIHEEGIHRLTMKNLGASMGISDAAIYRHFKDKKELLNSIADMLFHETTPRDEDPKNTLREIMVEQFKKFQSNPYLTSLLFQEEIFREYPEIKIRFDKFRKERFEAIKRAVMKGQSTGAFASEVDPEIFASIYMGSIRFSMLHWRFSGFHYPIEQLPEKIIDHLLRILGDA